MSYQVLARKWRPQTFSEVTGQETVTRTLQNAIQSGRIAHAFLFSGIRGVGKTTTARILAKALNCHQGPTISPCGTCVSCEEIAKSGSVDVLEIDAASNRRIDDVRELRESVRYGTARDRYKIFIIDEVHMLTNEAFNALLKTLEEPPPHVKLILATTEHHKIPVTITSRCQQYHFKPISFTSIFQKLREICGEEGIQINDYALRAVASIGQGSMRDAESSLDRIIAFSGREVRDEDVRALLGLVDSSHLYRVFNCVITEDRPGLIREVQELAEQGVDPLIFCRKLVEHVRNLLVFRTTGWDDTLLNLPDDERPLVEEQASRASELDLIRFYDLADSDRVGAPVALASAGSPRSGSGQACGAEAASYAGVGARQSGVRLADACCTCPPAIPPCGSGRAPAGGRSARIPPRLDAADAAGRGVGIGAPRNRRGLPGHRLTWRISCPLCRGRMSPLYGSLEHASAISLTPGRLTIRFPEKEATHMKTAGESWHLQFLTDLAGPIHGSPLPDRDREGTGSATGDRLPTLCRIRTCRTFSRSFRERSWSKERQAVDMNPKNLQKLMREAQKMQERMQEEMEQLARRSGQRGRYGLGSDGREEAPSFDQDQPAGGGPERRRDAAGSDCGGGRRGWPQGG